MKNFKLVLAAVLAISFIAGVSKACNERTKVGRYAPTAVAKNTSNSLGTNGLPVRSAVKNGAAIE